MARKRLHGDARGYWEYQREYAREVLMPLFDEWGWPWRGGRILEVGCSEAGILQAFADEGCDVTGVEVAGSRVRHALELQTSGFPVIRGDVSDPETARELNGPFDVIILRDVIEHIPDKRNALTHLRERLAPEGRIFLSFPPWYMPFGGHQQALRGPVRFIPFLHWLPRELYIRLLEKVEKDRPRHREDMINTYDCGLTVRRFHELVRTTGLALEQEKVYLLNPAYRFKFGMPTVSLGPLGSVPGLREVMATSVYAGVRSDVG